MDVISKRNGCSKMSISLLSLFVGNDGPATMGSKFEVTRV